MLEAILAALLVQQPSPMEYAAIAAGENDRVLILLQDVRGQCPEDSKRAVMLSKQRWIAWVGCWQARGGNVMTLWEDGDRIAMPVEALRWMVGKKPAGT